MTRYLDTMQRLRAWAADHGDLVAVILLDQRINRMLFNLANGY